MLVGQTGEAERLRDVFQVRGAPKRKRPHKVLDGRRAFRSQLIDDRRRVALAAEPAESGDSVGELVRHTDRLATQHREAFGKSVLMVQRLRETEPVPGRLVQRIEPDGAAYPALAFLGSAGVRRELADLADDLVVVGIQRQGALDVKFGLVEVAPQQMECGEHAMNLALGVVQPVRALNGIEAALDQRRLRIEERLLVQGAGEPRVTQRERGSSATARSNISIARALSSFVQR